MGNSRKNDIISIKDMKAIGFILSQQLPDGFVKTISMKLHRRASAEFSITLSSSTIKVLAL